MEEMVYNKPLPTWYLSMAANKVTTYIGLPGNYLHGKLLINRMEDGIVIRTVSFIPEGDTYMYIHLTTPSCIDV